MDAPGPSNKGKGKARDNESSSPAPSPAAVEDQAARIAFLEAQLAAAQGTKRKRRTKEEIAAAKAAAAEAKATKSVTKAAKSGKKVNGADDGDGGGAAVETRSVEERLQEHVPQPKKWSVSEMRSLKVNALKRHRELPYILCMETATMASNMVAGYLGYKGTHEVFAWLTCEHPKGSGHSE